MKLKLTILVIGLSLNFSFAQMQPILIILKNGEHLQGIGKRKSTTMKFKAHIDAEPQEFKFSEIKSAEIQLVDRKRVKMKFYQTVDNDKFISVDEDIIGNKVELYSRTFFYNSGGGFGMGGMQAVTNYYVKKPTEEKLLDLGQYSPLTNNLKGKVKEYFSDCKLLLEKLESRDFKVREGLNEIVTFYNESCE